MTKFSTDFKLNVVKFYLENNVSKHEIAKQFGVIKFELIKWIAKKSVIFIFRIKKNSQSIFVINQKV